MKRGEKPWEEKIAARREEEDLKRRKKGKKGARKSGVSTPKVGTPVPGEAVGKRKFEETPVEVGDALCPRK
jgi:hypothetical protein